MKITIEQLKNYLGIGLEYILLHDYHEEFYEFEDNELYEEAFKKGAHWKMVGYTDIEIPAGEGDLSGSIIQFRSSFYTDSSIAKPLFFKLSDLDKFIPELGFVPRDKIPMGDVIIEDGKIYASGDEYDYSVLPFYTFEWLIKHHFWVFDQSYFDEGLIIDKYIQ
jgi:hypothetical protein